MSSQRKSFIYYNDWAEQLLTLPDELRLKIDDAVKRFVLYGEEPTDEQVLYSMFGLMRCQLQRDAQQYEAVCAKRAEAGSKGGKQKVANQANATNCKQKVANQTDNKNDNKNKNKIDNKRATPQPQTAKRFSPPSIVEVEIYIKEMGYANVNAEEYVDYYTSKGWRVGNTPMKDWRASVRQWERRNKEITNNIPNYGKDKRTTSIGGNSKLFSGDYSQGFV